MEVRRFTQTPDNRENPGVLRTPGRAGPRGHPVRERWLNAWPANAPLRSRLGLGVTFVHFYVAHPVDNPAANLPHNLLIELEGHRYGGDGLHGLAVEKDRKSTRLNSSHL